MNIDLLFTAKGEAGLISSENLAKKLAGVVMDTQSGFFTLEFKDMDFLELNIPVEQTFNATLDTCPFIHIASVKDGHIGQAYQVPLMFLDDPYRAEMHGHAAAIPHPLAAFSYFVKAAVFGQPVHRDDLADDETMGCILGDATPSSLQFAPHLARRATMEAAPKAAPRAPGVNLPGMGLGGRSSSSGTHGGGYPTGHDDED